jgi:hypothetical protein
MMPAFETPRLSLNLLKCFYSHCICSPKTGITLFTNTRRYVHSEPPIVIYTVVVVVDNIASRQQRFRVASLLPQMMLANDEPGGEPTRLSAVSSWLQPNCNNVLVQLSFGVAPPMATAVVGACHCSLVIVLHLQTVAIISLILLLPPKRMPFLDHENVQGGQHTTTMVALHQSTRVGSRCCWPGSEDNPYQSSPFLCWSLGGIGGAIGAM